MTPDEKIQELEKRVEELERRDPFRPTTLWPLMVPHQPEKPSWYPSWYV